MLVRAFIALTTQFTAEDAFITLRYAENLASGAGWCYNPGERVLGTTSPLYTLFLAGAAQAGFPALAAGKCLNILCDGLLCVVVYRWLAGLGREADGRLAAALIAVHPLFIRWSISGMETSLAALLGAAAWERWSRGRLWAAYGLLGALFLARWDGLALAGALTVAEVARSRRVPWGPLGLMAAICTPWLYGAAWHFGNPIPGTAAAKWTVYHWPGARELFPGSSPFWRRLVGDPATLAANILAVGGVWVCVRERVRFVMPALIWALAVLTLIGASGMPVFEWHLVPALAAHTIFLAVGLGAVTRWPGWPAWTRPARAILGGLAAGALVMQAATAAGRTQEIENRLRRPLAEQLAELAAPGDRIMLEPIGVIGYYSNRRILDVIGLVSPEVLPIWRSGVGYPLWEIAERFRPEWCVLRPAELEHVRAGARAAGTNWEARYTRINSSSLRRRGDRQPFVFYVYRRQGSPGGDSRGEFPPSTERDGVPGGPSNP